MDHKHLEANTSHQQRSSSPQPSRDLDAIVAAAKAEGDARARAEKAQSSKNSEIPAGQQSTDEYNSVHAEEEDKGTLKGWWRRQKMDRPHGAVAAVDAVGQGALDIVRFVFGAMTRGLVGV